MKKNSLCFAALALAFCFGSGCSTPGNQPPLGAFDAIRDGRVVGWALDRDSGGRPIAIHVYANASAGGGGTLVATGTADGRRPDMNAANGEPGDHGFDIAIPAVYLTVARAYYVYALDSGGGLGTQLEGSPRTRAPAGNDAR